MRTIQFDECASAKKILRDCRNQGLVNVKKFPGGMAGKGIKDPEMINRLLIGGDPLLTVDKNLPIAHASDIPNCHPGIIVINNDGPFSINKFITIEILSNIKFLVSNWPNISFENSIIKISETKIRVDRIVDGVLIEGQEMAFTEPHWREKTLEVVANNAALSPN